MTLLLTGCASMNEWHPFPYGELMFSIRETQGAFNGATEKETGIFFHLDDAGIITGYVAEAGRRTEFIPGNEMASSRLRFDLREIGFEAFDFKSEVRSIKEAMRARGEIGPMTLDGAEYEIRFVFEGVDYTLTEWNPRTEIDAYATMSPQIARLKAVLDRFARHYGHTRIWNP